MLIQFDKWFVKSRKELWPYNHLPCTRNAFYQMKYVIVHDSFEETYVDFPDGVGHHYWDDRLGYQILSLKDLPSGSRVILITSGDCRIVPPIHNAYVSFLKLSGDGLSQAWKQQCLKVLWEMLQPRHPLHLNPCVYKLWRTPKFVTDNSLTTLAQPVLRQIVCGPGSEDHYIW